MTSLKSIIAFLVLLIACAVTLTSCLISATLKAAGIGRRPFVPSGRIVVTGTFHNPNWFLSHLQPLARSRVNEVIVVADVPHADIEGIEYFCPPPWIFKIFGRAIGKLIWIVRAGIRYNPDLYMGYHIFPNGLNALIAAKVFNRKACYQCCGGPVEVIGGGIDCENRLMAMLAKPSAVLDYCFKKIVSYFDMIIVRGTSAAQYFGELTSPERIRVIPGSIHIEEHLPPGEREVDLIYVGRMEPIKQPRQVVQVVARLVQQGINLRVQMVGTGVMLEELEKLAAELGVQGNIEFLGQRKDIESLLSNAQIFILTSRSEGLSIAMAEAMAAGTVPVVANVGDLSDLVESGKNGYLIEPDNLVEYSDSIQKLLSDRVQTSQISKNAHAKVLGYSAIKVIAGRWSSCFEALQIIPKADGIST